MKIPDELPELADLIPSLEGDIYSYYGNTYFAPRSMAAAVNTIDIDDRTLIRVGFKLYSVKGWDGVAAAYEVVPFSATINQYDMEWLWAQQ